MRSELEAALSGEPWAVSGVVFGLHVIRDDEGRPVHERRAPSAVKRGVPMELRGCPYDDERHGVLMNVSALAQITRHLGAVTEDAGTFRSTISGAERWDPMLMTVMDQLASPAIHLLRLRDPHGPVPAAKAVAHKVAAGYFGALHRLLLAEGRGDRGPVSAAAFLEYVRAERILVGPSEACAGPPHMIARLTELLVHGMVHGSPRTLAPDETRQVLARGLGNQVHLGVAWELFDDRMEREFFRRWHLPGRLRLRNAFIGQKLDARASALTRSEGAPADRAARALPTSLGADALEPIRRVLSDGELHGEANAAAVRAIDELLAQGEGAIQLVDASLRPELARSIAHYLGVYRAFVAALWSIERELRERLGFSREAPMKLHAVILPIPRCLDWYTAVLGHRLECPPGGSGAVTLRNHRRVVEVMGAVPTRRPSS